MRFDTVWYEHSCQQDLPDWWWRL